MKTRGNESINFLPIVTLFLAIFTIETAVLNSTQHDVGRGLMLLLVKPQPKRTNAPVEQSA